MDEVAALQQRLRLARLRRGRSTRSSAQIPCNVPTRRTDEGLRRADSGPDRLEGCLRLCQRRRVVAFVRWSSVHLNHVRDVRLQLGGSLGPRAWGARQGRGSNLRAACGCAAATYSDLRLGGCCASGACDVRLQLEGSLDSIQHTRRRRAASGTQGSVDRRATSSQRRVRQQDAYRGFQEWWRICRRFTPSWTQAAGMPPPTMLCSL
jgi:hypothetical protein